MLLIPTRKTHTAPATSSASGRGRVQIRESKRYQAGSSASEHCSEDFRVCVASGSGLRGFSAALPSADIEQTLTPLLLWKACSRGNAKPATVENLFPRRRGAPATPVENLFPRDAADDAPLALLLVEVDGHWCALKAVDRPLHSACARTPADLLEHPRRGHRRTY